MENCMNYEVIYGKNQSVYTDFLALPCKLYQKNDLTQDYDTEYKLLSENHILSKYFKCTPFVVIDKNAQIPVARCMLTYYPEDDVAYFGFFESVDDQKIVDLLLDTISEKAKKDGKVKLVKVDMGNPELVPANIPIVADGDRVIDEPINVNGTEYRMTGVSMGNPHAVVYVEDVKGLDIEKIGPAFENHERFPNRVNTEFVKVLDQNTVEMRVWERGSGETMACGTGACAVAVACILNGLTEDKVTVKLLGGDLQIEWDKEADKVYMTGPAEVSFDGEINL